MTQLQRRRIPDAAVTRLPVYLQILNNLHATNVLRFSSDELAALAGVNAAKVRKDLSYLGSYGTSAITAQIRKILSHLGRVYAS
ncbi:MAG: winged-helix domain-containing protein, partial [Acidimicrobiaceae bacterium]